MAAIWSGLVTVLLSTEADSQLAVGDVEVITSPWPSTATHVVDAGIQLMAVMESKYAITVCSFHFAAPPVGSVDVTILPELLVATHRLVDGQDIPLKPSNPGDPLRGSSLTKVRSQARSM
jgi:hypothetical protein